MYTHTLTITSKYRYTIIKAYVYITYIHILI